MGGGLAVVQDPGLEAEADRMGARAAMVSSPIQRKLATTPSAGRLPASNAGMGRAAPVGFPLGMRTLQPMRRSKARAVDDNPPDFILPEDDHYDDSDLKNAKASSNEVFGMEWENVNADIIMSKINNIIIYVKSLRSRDTSEFNKVTFSLSVINKAIFFKVPKSAWKIYYIKTYTLDHKFDQE